MAVAPPKSGVVIKECQYKTGRVLGSGSYSVVKECVRIDTGYHYAAKVINKRLMAGREHMIRNEIAILKKISLGHNNILTLVDYFETMNNLYLVTDLALGGELFDRICRKGSYTEQDASDIVRTILSAVAYLHDNGIVHRDLKPENLLFRTPENNADLLIADFGLSRIMDEEQYHALTTTCGTPGYMAPEIFKKSGHGKPVDLWAIGVITFFLLCGYTPFDRDNNLEEMTAIINADYNYTSPYWDQISGQARSFIDSCLVIDPAARMTAHLALQHPWITGVADEDEETAAKKRIDLLPNVRKNFNARVHLHAAIDTIRAINQLRAGQGIIGGGPVNAGPKGREREPMLKNIAAAASAAKAPVAAHSQAAQQQLHAKMNMMQQVPGHIAEKLAASAAPAPEPMEDVVHGKGVLGHEQPAQQSGDVMDMTA